MGWEWRTCKIEVGEWWVEEREGMVIMKLSVPPLAGNDADLLYFAICRHLPCLPPLVVRGVQHMQDVPEAEVQPLTGEARVLCPVIVKQRSATQQPGMNTVRFRAVIMK